MKSAASETRKVPQEEPAQGSQRQRFSFFILFASYIFAMGYTIFQGISSAQSLPAFIFLIALSAIAISVFYFPGSRLLQFGAWVFDLLYLVAIAFLMITLGSSGSTLFVYYIVFIATCAFSEKTFQYHLRIMMLLATLCSLYAYQTLLGPLPSGQTVFLQLSTVIAFAVLFRIFASEQNELKKKQDELTARLKQISAQKDEIYHMIDTISEGIIAVDKDEQITFVNKSAIALTGTEHTEAKLLGVAVDEVLKTSTDEGSFSIFEEALKSSGQTNYKELKLIGKEKVLRVNASVSTISDTHGKTTGAIVLLTDITGKFELDEQREEFLAIASHELRTPLTVIEGYLFYLLDDKSLKYDAKTRDYLEKTYEAAKNLISLSNDILAVTKEEKKKLTINLGKIKLENLIRTAVKAFEGQAKAKGIKIEVEASDLPEIETDQEKISEVLNNLIENAVKFTEKGSVKVSAIASGKEVTVSVTDTGVGIGKSDQKKIFTKFYRTEDWQTRKVGGSGLGLYIAKMYIDRLGGKIGLESVTGKGSRFFFTLPLYSEKKKQVSRGEKQLSEFIEGI